MATAPQATLLVGRGLSLCHLEQLMATAPQAAVPPDLRLEQHKGRQLPHKIPLCRLNITFGNCPTSTSSVGRRLVTQCMATAPQVTSCNNCIMTNYNSRNYITGVLRYLTYK